MKVAVVLALACLSSLLWGGSRHSASLVFINATLLDSRYQSVESRATVLIKDETIIGVAKVAIVETGADVRVINAAGKYLVPAPWRPRTLIAPAQALQAALPVATSCATELIPRDFVATGRTADLVLLEDDPLDCRNRARRIAGVVLRGQYFSRATLEELRAPNVAQRTDSATPQAVLP